MDDLKFDSRAHVQTKISIINRKCVISAPNFFSIKRLPCQYFHDFFIQAWLISRVVGIISSYKIRGDPACFQIGKNIKLLDQFLKILEVLGVLGKT